MSECDDFNELDYEDLVHPKCPSCGEEPMDIHNGGDPGPWWNIDNIPDGHFQCTCPCGQVYRITSRWSPVFDCVPIECDCDYDDYSGLEKVN